MKTIIGSWFSHALISRYYFSTVKGYVCLLRDFTDPGKKKNRHFFRQLHILLSNRFHNDFLEKISKVQFGEREIYIDYLNKHDVVAIFNHLINPEVRGS